MGKTSSNTAHLKHLLQGAIVMGREDAVCELIHQGADVNAVNNLGHAPLATLSHYSTLLCRQRTHIALALVEAGALEQNTLFPLLRRAASCGYSKIAQALLINKALDLEFKDGWGRSLLHTAARHANSTIVDTLLQSGCSIDPKNEIDSATPLHEVAECRYNLRTKNAKEDSTKVLHTLLTKGASVNATTKDHSTPLHKAAMSGNAVASRMLINAGAIIDPKNDHGSTPLHNAAKSGDFKTALVLINQGANLDVKNKAGFSPLQYENMHYDKLVTFILPILFRNPFVCINKKTIQKIRERLMKWSNETALKLFELLIERSQTMLEQSTFWKADDIFKAYAKKLNGLCLKNYHISETQFTMKTSLSGWAADAVRKHQHRRHLFFQSPAELQSHEGLLAPIAQEIEARPAIKPVIAVLENLAKDQHLDNLNVFDELAQCDDLATQCALGVLFAESEENTANADQIFETIEARDLTFLDYFYHALNNCELRRVQPLEKHFETALASMISILEGTRNEMCRSLS